MLKRIRKKVAVKSQPVENAQKWEKKEIIITTSCLTKVMLEKKRILNVALKYIRLEIVV